MIKRKKLIVHRSQLKLVKLFLIFSAVFFVTITAFAAYISIGNYQKNRVISDRIGNAVKTENTIIKSYLDYARSTGNERLISRVETMKAEHEGGAAAIGNYRRELNDENRNYFMLLMFAFLAYTLLAVVLIFYIIRMTNRIFGPVYAMSRMVRDFNRTGEIFTRELRDKDEFAALYKNIITLMENSKLRGMKLKEIRKSGKG